jgi:hypothetical protein
MAVSSGWQPFKINAMTMKADTPLGKPSHKKSLWVIIAAGDVRAGR